MNFIIMLSMVSGGKIVTIHHTEAVLHLEWSLSQGMRTSFPIATRFHRPPGSVFAQNRPQNLCVNPVADPPPFPHLLPCLSDDGLNLKPVHSQQGQFRHAPRPFLPKSFKNVRLREIKLHLILIAIPSTKQREYPRLSYESLWSRLTFY